MIVQLFVRVQLTSLLLILPGPANDCPTLRESPAHLTPLDLAWTLCGVSSVVLIKCCFTSTNTVGLLGTGAKGGHLDFHTAPELCLCSTCRLLLQQDHDGQVSFSGPQGSVRCKRSLDVSLWLYHYHCISQVVGYLLVSHRGYRMMGLRLHITGSLPPPSRAISDHGDYLKIQSPYDQLLLLIAFLYSAILRSRADSVRSHVIQHE